MGLIGTLKIVSCLGGANSVSYASASQVGPGNTENRDLVKFVADLKFMTFILIIRNTEDCI
jgi:hypothetical protein